MAIAQKDYDEISTLRQKYSDTDILERMAELKPERKAILQNLRQKYTDSVILNQIIDKKRMESGLTVPTPLIDIPKTGIGEFRKAESQVLPATTGIGELRRAEAKQVVTPQQKKQVIKEQAIAEFDKTRQWKPKPELSAEENEALRKELGQKQLLRPTGEEALRLGFLFPRKGTPLYEGSGAYKSIMDWVHPHTEEIKKGLTEPYAKSASNAILENELRKTMKGKEYADRINEQMTQGIDHRTAMVNILKDKLVNNPDKAQINELISNLSSNNAMPTPEELGKDFSKQFLTKHFTKEQAMKQPQAIRRLQETFVSPESSKLSRGEYVEPQSMAQLLMNTPAVVAGDLLANPEDVPGLVLVNYLVGRGMTGAMKALPQDLAYIKVTEFFRRPYLAMRGKAPKVKIKPEEAEAMRQTFNESVKVDLDKTAEYMGVDRAYLERGLKRVSKAVESAANGQDVYMIVPWKRVKNAPRVIPRFKINGKNVEVSSQPPQPMVKAIGEAEPEITTTPEPEVTAEGFSKGDNVIFRNMEATVESVDPQTNIATINVNGKTYQKNVSELKKKPPVVETEAEQVETTQELPEYIEPVVKSEAPAIQRQMAGQEPIEVTPEPEIPYKVTRADIDAELSQYNADQVSVAQKAVDDFLQANGGQLTTEQQNRLLQYVLDGKANRLVYDLKVLDAVEDYGDSDKLFADMLADRINIWDIVSPEVKTPTEPSVTEPLTMPFGNLPEQQAVEPTQVATPEQPLPEQAIEQPPISPELQSRVNKHIDEINQLGYEGVNRVKKALIGQATGALDNGDEAMASDVVDLLDKINGKNYNVTQSQYDIIDDLYNNAMDQLGQISATNKEDKATQLWWNNFKGKFKVEQPPVEQAVEPKATEIPEPTQQGEKPNAMVEEGRTPIQQVNANEIEVKPELMQYKQVSNRVTGENEAEKLKGQWDDLKGGVLLLWQPNNPAEYGLKAEQKYIVANGHHRFRFGKEQNINNFNAQILRESEGYSVNDARSIAAEVNITEGRGTVYDQVKFLREQAGTYGKNEAMGRAGSLGVKGRQASTIAFETDDSLYSAFINEVISPEQTEIIARQAPNNDIEQQVGIKLALRGLQGVVLRGTMKAMESDRAIARGAGKQLDLLGQDDSYIQMTEAKSKIAIDERKALKQKILAVSGAVKRPDLARTLGVDVTDPVAVKAEVERLRGEMARWDNWSQYPDLVERVNQKYNRQVEIEAGTPKEQGLDLGVKAESQTPEAKVKQAFSNPVITKDAKGNPYKIPQPKRLHDLMQEKNPFERKKAIKTLLTENSYKFPDDIKAGSYVIADDPDNFDLIAQGVGKAIKVDDQDNIADVQFNDALRRVDMDILTNVINPKIWDQQGFMRLPKKPDFLQSRHWKMLKNNPEQRQKFLQHIDTETQLQGGWKSMKQLRQRDVGRATAKLFGEIFGTSIDPILDYDIKRAWKIANDKSLTPEERMGAEITGILSNRAKSIIRNQVTTSGTNGYIDANVEWDKVKHGLSKNEEMELMYAITEWSQAMTSSIGLKVDPKIGFSGYIDPLLKDLGYNPNDPHIESKLFNPEVFMANEMENYMNGTETIGKQTPILNPKVLNALRNYYKLQAEAGDMIVARNVGLNEEDRFSFYFRHNVMEYMTEKINQVITKRGRLKTTLEKQPFLKQRFGTEKGIQTHPDAVIQYLSRLYGSLKFDEAIENAYRQTNVWKRGNINGVWDETDLQMFMDTESWDKFNRNGIEQAEIYTIAGQNFIGATPSNANAKNRTMYLIPLSVYNALGALTTNSGDLGIMPILTGVWKQAVLSPIGAGLPYLMLNVYGNLKMLETANIKAFAKLIPFHSTASQFIKKIASGGQLTQDEERLFKEMSRQDVFNSNMLVDINQIRSKTSIPLLKKWWDLNSGFDTLSKVALYMTLDDEFRAWQRKNPGVQYDPMNPKEVFTTAGMNKMVMGLESEDVKGRIAKQMLIDYPDVSQFFQKGIRGFAVPFATFPLKAIGNYFRYARREPLKFGLKEFLPWILLSAYNWLAQPDTEKNIGGLGSRLHFNLFTHTFPDGGTYGFVLAPLAPRDIAFNLLGFNRMYGDFLKWKTLKESGNGDVYPLSQLLKDWAWDIPTGASRTFMTALTPIIQAPISLLRNRDMRTGKSIVPPSAEVFDSKYNWWHYQAPWLFGQIANPIANFIDTFAVASQAGRSIKANEFTMQVSALDILTDIASQKTGLDLNLPSTARRIIPPLDIVRGMGFYAVNLEKAEQIAQNEIIRNSQEDTARLMKMSEDKVRDMIVKEFTDAQKKGIMELWIANEVEAKRVNAIYELTGQKPPKMIDINLSGIAEGILDDPGVQKKILQYSQEYGTPPQEVIEAIKDRVMTPASLIAMLDQIIVTSKVDLGSWAEMKKKAYMRDSLGLGGNIPETAKEKTIMDMQKLRQSQRE